MSYSKKIFLHSTESLLLFEQITNIKAAPMPLVPTSLAKTLSGAILDTILSRLALLFLSATAGDLVAAPHAAAQMLAAYHPGNEDELRLAAEIVSFSLHALQALAQACEPDMPMTRILRLRGSAVQPES